MQSSFGIAQTRRPKLRPLGRGLSSCWQGIGLHGSCGTTHTKNVTPLVPPPHFWAPLSVAS